MPGALVRDALAPNLLTGATLGSAATSNGDVVRIGKPGLVTLVLTTATVTGTNPTLKVTLKGAANSAFDSEVTTLAEFPITAGNAGANSDLVLETTTRIDKEFVRATITTGGTNPVYTGSTLKVRQENDRRTPKTDSSAQ